MKVLLDARISPGTMGGVQEVITGLAQGLAELSLTDDVTFLTTQHEGWLRDTVDGLNIVPARRATSSTRGAVDALRRRLIDAVPRLNATPLFASPVPPARALVPVNSLDVVHFVTQQGFSTAVPSVYSPYDLLHLHHPEFFSAGEVARRERIYRMLCRQAQLVMAMTPWVRNDLVDRYGLDEDRVRVVPLGVTTGASHTVSPSEIRDRYGLPSRFALYPAHTWPHKNHLRLLEALALVRDHHGLAAPLVLVGHHDSYVSTIYRARDRLGLTDQVHLLGRVPASDLRALYGVAHCLVFPSLFEGWGMPVFEAFANRVPVACSTATSLPEQTRGGALLFDPLDVDAMAAGMARIWHDEALRQRLVAAGQERVRTLTWHRMARTYYALYREVAGQPLDALDRKLVNASQDGSVEGVAIPDSAR